MRFFDGFTGGVRDFMGFDYRVWHRYYGGWSFILGSQVVI